MRSGSPDRGKAATGEGAGCGEMPDSVLTPLLSHPSVRVERRVGLELSVGYQEAWAL